jgi:hypothetical protein
LKYFLHFLSFVVPVTLLFACSNSPIFTIWPIMIYTILFAASAFVSAVSSHGIITSPPVRAVGPAMTAACGASVAALVTADNTSHIEGEPEAAAQTANFNSTACNVFMCKGLQFADNTANVQTFQPGQVVNMLASIPIPHEGPMNVSVVNTQTNTAIGAPLITFVSYADESLAQLPANNTNFNVTIPTTLGSTCAVAGTCVSYIFHG